MSRNRNSRIDPRYRQLSMLTGHTMVKIGRSKQKPQIDLNVFDPLLAKLRRVHPERDPERKPGDIEPN